MSDSEFDLIQRYFTPSMNLREDVMVGVGDDAAVLRVPENHALVVTTDTLVSGVHFLPDWSPEDIAHRVLAANLSDLAAMGAVPAWVTLALTLPAVDEPWLAAFSRYFSQMLASYRVQLVGGDMTQGPLAITVQAMGSAKGGQCLKRTGAEVGDYVFLTGEVGTAALALAALQAELKLSPHDLDTVLPALLRPQPLLLVGQALLGLATSAIDISDGLAADLQHILTRSGVGADIQLEKVPVHPLLLAKMPYQEAYELALTGGDDYQLCFTVPEEKCEQVLLQLPQCVSVGQISKAPGLRIFDEQHRLFSLSRFGYQHFRGGVF